jgi:hypothetical protein
MQNKIEIIASDGKHTIGHIDGMPCEWEGNCNTPDPENDITPKKEDSTFGVQCTEEYIVRDGKWEVNA